ncbi:MAG: hypothetical protein KIT87_21690 [Anaerolineae bacterium]|nr:hypothetical protein [Anaerolineae bacterium]
MMLLTLLALAFWLALYLGRPVLKAEDVEWLDGVILQDTRTSSGARLMRVATYSAEFRIDGSDMRLFRDEGEFNQEVRAGNPMRLAVPRAQEGYVHDAETKAVVPTLGLVSDTRVYLALDATLEARRFEQTVLFPRLTLALSALLAALVVYPTLGKARA